MALILTLPAVAQSEKELIKPKVGTVQVELLMGNTGFFTQESDGFNYLIAGENSV